MARLMTTEQLDNIKRDVLSKLERSFEIEDANESNRLIEEIETLIPFADEVDHKIWLNVFDTGTGEAMVDWTIECFTNAKNKLITKWCRKILDSKGLSDENKIRFLVGYIQNTTANIIHYYSEEDIKLIID